MTTPDKRPIEIRCSGTGESFTFDPPDALWLQMQAFCEARHMTIEQLIVDSLREFLPRVVRQ